MMLYLRVACGSSKVARTLIVVSKDDSQDDFDKTFL